MGELKGYGDDNKGKFVCRWPQAPFQQWQELVDLYRDSIRPGYENHGICRELAGMDLVTIAYKEAEDKEGGREAVLIGGVPGVIFNAHE